MFIRATTSISPQYTFDKSSLLKDIVIPNSNRLKCIEPNYSDFIDSKLMRRMTRIIKLGASSGMRCLSEAEIEMPDAIITGTGLGCMEDTGVFIQRMIENNETLLTPTSFIQSTHNTIGAQIGLMLKCNNYNNTFVHRGHSFESALIDAKILLEENGVNNVLVGGIDEITDISHQVISRMGFYKNENNLNNKATRGTIAGEGASFFLLTHKISESNYCKVNGVKTFYNINDSLKIQKNIEQFLEHSGIKKSEIDLFITGKNGDFKNDNLYDDISNQLFAETEKYNFKNLCGEYPTATGFSLWLASNILKDNTIYSRLNTYFKNDINRILIYNNFLSKYHTLILLSRC